MAVTRDGLPVRSWVFYGNTVDVTTVEKVKQDLRGWRLGRCVFVGDAGMNSEENRRTLALGAGKYILAARMRAGDDDKLDEAWKRQGLHSRMDLFRKSLHDYLAGAGENEVAALLTDSAL